MTERWIRSQRAAVADVGDRLLLIGADGAIRELPGDSGELARAVLAFLDRPRAEPEIFAHVNELAGDPPSGDQGHGTASARAARREVIGQLLQLLASVGAISAARGAGAAANATAASVPRLNVVVAVSGAIAAAQTPAVVTALQRRGHTVEVALTATAARFVAVDALAAIAQREIHTSMWPRAPHVPVPHIALAQWADLVVVCPASATTIGRIAAGDFSDLVAAIALTTPAPVILAPSMNPDMLEAPAVRRNLELLRADGHVILHPVPSQEVADAPSRRTSQSGAAPAPSEMVAAIEALLAAGVLVHRREVSSGVDAPGGARRQPSADARAWEAVYRAGSQATGSGAAGSAPLVPWASDTCDDDIAAALRQHAPSPRRLLDLGCGLGQIARHAARAGYRVVATDVSETALALARDRAAADSSARGAPGAQARAQSAVDDIVWLRDDICATALLGPFDVIVDRAVLHALPPRLAPVWAATLERLAAPGAIAILKCHRDGVPGATTGWNAAALAKLLSDFELVSEHPAELPGQVDAAPAASVLVVLRRR